MNPLISATLWIFILIGMAAIIRQRPRLASALLFPALLYFFYLSTQKVMIVRNTLVLLPVLCLCLGTGIAQVIRLLKQYEPHLKWGVVTLSVLVFSSSVSNYSAINHSLHLQPVGDEVTLRVLSTASEHEGDVYLSAGVASLLRSSDQVGPEQLVRTDVLDPYDTSTVTIFMISETLKKEGYFETGDWKQIALANRRGLYTTLAGPLDVDLDYYPNWKGRNRIVVTGSEAGANFAYWKLTDTWKLRLND